MNNVLLENSNLCPQSHYGNLRNVFTMGNIHVVHSIFRCVFRTYFFPNNTKKKIFWLVLSLHILVQQLHEIVKFCIHKTHSLDSLRLCKYVGDESVHDSSSGLWRVKISSLMYRFWFCALDPCMQTRPPLQSCFWHTSVDIQDIAARLHQLQCNSTQLCFT